MESYIRIDDWPPDHAQKARDDGYFVEAIQVLHSWLEIQARGLLIMVGSVHFSVEMAATWDTVDTMSYKDVVRALFALGQLEKDEADELLHINAARNRLIHDVFKEPYEKIHHGFPRCEFDQVFEQALKWADQLLSKIEAMV